MVTFWRWFNRLTIIAGYWLCALWVIFKVSPISVDNLGPSATFYWGCYPPSPTLREYEASIASRLPFLYPYWGAATIITFCGCGLAPLLVRLWKPARSHLFLTSPAVTLASLLLVLTLSDIG